jgi:alpha-amylase
MSGSVTLLMAIHCHQPVGNFGFVFEQAYTEAYEPFLRILERHPAVRLALHYSGCLLDWLAAHRPTFLDRVRALVHRGQVELLASGYYEPILPLIPEADRQGQIAAMRQALRTRCGVRVEGLWLSERVWEPDLPATLARAGIRYTMVDSNQFLAARPWIPSNRQVEEGQFVDLLGSYATEYGGQAVRLFPASKRLRYWMPFQPVDRTIQFLKRLRRDEPVAVTFADDGEKFGLWPSTHRWVYDEGWLDQFLTALEREGEWLSTTTFHDYVDTTRPDGYVWLPSGSYEEMLEWSGGHFRNFFAKYPEANAMQQKMLRVSARLQAAGSTRRRSPHASARLRQAQRELYTGQCNCAYWHGVFGGLYLSHLRRAVYAHVIAAEALTNEAVGSGPSPATRDVDGDGQDEALIQTAAMGLVVDPEEGGAVTEWSLYRPRLNLLDTLSRRYEPYHEKLKTRQSHLALSAAGRIPSTIHEVLGVKEENLASHLIYDDHRRSAFLDYALDRMPTLQEVVGSALGERRLWSPGPFRLEPARRGKGTRQAQRLSMVRTLGGGSIRKTIEVVTHRSVVECRYELEGLDVPVVGLEFNLSLRDERYLGPAGERALETRFDLEEPTAGVSLSLSIDPPATLMRFPIETVSESEGGLERTYQGLCLMCLWARRGQGRWTSRLRWAVDTR